MSTKTDSLLKAVEDQLTKSLVEIKAEISKLETVAASVTGGKPEKVEFCKIQGICATRRVDSAGHNGGLYHRPSFEENVKAARRALSDERTRLLDVHTKNMPAIEHNKKCIAQLTQIMEAAGVASTYQVYELPTSRSRNKQWIKKSAGFVEDLRRTFTVYDAYDMCVRALDEYEKSINTYEESQIRAMRQEAAELDKQRRVTEGLKTLALLSAKYSSSMSLSAVQDAMFDSDKYLALAHALYKNREDWNDGPHFAQTGLDRFIISSPHDQEIYDSIYNHCQNWDGDGRVFRDTEFNYDYLFGLARPEAVEDYNKLMPLFDILGREYR